jgi:hypothetical protein
VEYLAIDADRHADESADLWNSRMIDADSLMLETDPQPTKLAASNSARKEAESALASRRLSDCKKVLLWNALSPCYAALIRVSGNYRPDLVAQRQRAPLRRAASVGRSPTGGKASRSGLASAWPTASGTNAKQVSYVAR